MDLSFYMYRNDSFDVVEVGNTRGGSAQTDKRTHTHTNGYDDDVMMMMGNAGILQLCNTARHNVVIIYVPIYHAFYYLMHI